MARRAAVWAGTFTRHFRFAYWPGIWLGAVASAVAAMATYLVKLASAGRVMRRFRHGFELRLARRFCYTYHQSRLCTINFGAGVVAIPAF